MIPGASCRRGGREFLGHSLFSSLSSVSASLRRRPPPATGSSASAASGSSAGASATALRPPPTISAAGQPLPGGNAGASRLRARRRRCRGRRRRRASGHGFGDRQRLFRSGALKSIRLWLRHVVRVVLRSAVVRMILRYNGCGCRRSTETTAVLSILLLTTTPTSVFRRPRSSVTGHLPRRPARAGAEWS
jgi:hypothetical protein